MLTSSMINSITIEDLMEEFKSVGMLSVYVSNDTGLMIQPTDSSFATGYGESETSVPCDAIEFVFDSETSSNEEVENQLNKILDIGVARTCAIAKEYIDKEIIDTDVSDNLPKDVEIETKSKLGGLWREFNDFDKIIFCINKAKNVDHITALWYTAKRDIIMNLREEKELARLCRMRVNTIKSAIQRVFYERNIKKAYSQSYLVKVAHSISNDKAVSENDKVALRKVFNHQDYNVCKQNGWVFNMIKNKKVTCKV